MIKLKSIIGYCFFFSVSVFSIDVSVSPASFMVRGETTPMFRVVVENYDVGDTLKLDISVLGAVDHPNFSSSAGNITRVRVYKDVFDSLNLTNNLIKDISTGVASDTLTIDNIVLDEEDFELIVIADLDSDGAQDPDSIQDLRVTTTEDDTANPTLGPFQIPIAYFKIITPDGSSASTACTPELKAGVVANTFAIDLFDKENAFIIQEQTQSLPVMIFEIEAFGASLDLQSIIIDNQYTGQQVEEKFQIDSDSRGLSTAELIHLNDDPCAISNGVVNFLNQELYTNLGFLSNLDEDITNNFETIHRGTFSGDHVQNSDGETISIDGGENEFFLISYKLCPTCTALDPNGDQRFITSARLVNESVRVRYSVSLGDAEVTYTIDSKNYTTNAPTLSGRSFQEFMSLNFNPDLYQGLVSQSHVFSPGTQAEVFKMEVKPQGINSLDDNAQLNSLILKLTEGDFNELSKIRAFTDSALQNNVATVTDFPDANRVTIPLHAVNDSDTEGLAMASDTSLFFTYEFLPNAKIGNYNSIVFSGSGSIDGTVLDLIGPLNTTPNVTSDLSSIIQLTNQQVSVTNIDLSIRPEKAIEGMLFVPVLWFELNSTSQLDNQSFLITNTFNMFNNQNKGVRRVSIFNDVNNNFKLDLGTDDLLSSAVPSPESDNMASEIQLENITVVSGRSQYIVAYDIGREVDPASATVDALFNGIVSTSVSGVLPGPRGGDSLNIIQNRVTLKTVKATDRQGDDIQVVGFGNTEFINYTIEVDNQFSEPIGVVNISPVAFKESISGLNITQQFTIGDDSATTIDGENGATSISEDNITIINPGQTTSFNYDVTVSDLTNTGQVVMDALVTFQIIPGVPPNDEDLENVSESLTSLFRYQSETRKSAAGLTPSQIAQPDNDKIVVFETVNASTALSKDFEFPGFVDTVTVTRANQEFSFLNFHPMSSGESLSITFNTPEQIDLISAIITLSSDSTGEEVLLQRNDQGIESTFYTVTSAGTDDASIQINNIQSLGDGLNKISIQLNDLAGNSLDDFELAFFMSNSVTIDHFYFFPNPFSKNILDATNADGFSDLEFGFSITHQPESVNLYIVNSVGRLIADISYDVNNPQFNLLTSGYKRLSTNLKNKLSPGIYIGKLIVKDSSGREVSKVSKFAVY